MTQTLNTTTMKLNGIVPLYPLSYVQTKTRNVSLKVGEKSYTDNIDLNGYNGKKAPYYGFNAEYGKWIVTDEDGKEWSESDAPIELITNKDGGYTSYTAVNPGKCKLRYIIDENAYSLPDNANAFTKNSDLTSTADCRPQFTIRPRKR